MTQYVDWLSLEVVVLWRLESPSRYLKAKPGEDQHPILLEPSMSRLLPIPEADMTEEGERLVVAETLHWLFP